MMRKYIPYTLPAALLVIILLALPGKDTFLLDAGEIIDKISNHEYIISSDQLKIIQEKETVVLVDLNPPGDFKNSSLPGAINLPLADLTLKSILRSFTGPGPYILYSKETVFSCNAWVLLTQMGYENIFVLNTD